MPSTNRQTYDDQLLVRFLLGSLEGAEVDRFDELSISDDEFAARLRTVEDDLVDDYVNGRLSGEILARFESHYLESPSRRQKVAFARTLRAHLNRVSPHSVPAPRIAARRGNVFRALAIAASLLLIAGSVLLVEVVRLRRQMSDSRTAQATLEERQRELQRQLAEQQSVNAGSTSELAQLRESIARLEERAAGDRSGSALPRELNIATIVLTPPTRGIGQIPVVTPPSRGYVAVQLQLESNDFSTYRAGLKDLTTNRVVWTSSPLKARSADGTQVVSIGLRADLLKPQRYSLELSGLDARGVGTPLGSYIFRVTSE
jgi:hypothetical protein